VFNRRNHLLVLVGDIFKRRAHSGFGLLSPPHDRPPSLLGIPPVTNQQMSYAQVLRISMTTGTFNTICVKECGLLRVESGCCRPEMMVVGTDLPLSISFALFLRLAMILLPILRQEQ